MANRRFLAVPIVLCLAAGASADEVGIPDNDPTTGAACNAIPFSASFGQGEFRYQAQVSAAAIGRPGRITELSFAPGSSGVFAAPDFVVTMAHNPGPVASCAFDANMVNPVVVYSGPFTYNYVLNQWSPLGLQCDFDYDGVQDLVVEIKYRGGQGGACFYRTSTEPRRTVAWGLGSYLSPTGSICNESAGLKMRLTFTEVKILGGNPVPGGVLNLGWNAPRDGNLVYTAGAALASTPGIPVGCRTIPLALDGVLLLSLSAPSIFSSFIGILDPTGNAAGAINIPQGPFTGITIHLSFVTVTQTGGVKSIAGGTFFTIQ